MNLSQANLVTFCCLGYNHAKFLKENLDSIVCIGYDNIEVIVVDDGSTDNSVELLEKIKEDFPYPLEIIAQANTGNIGKNFNNAIKKAKGQLISIIALDDVFNAKTMLAEINEMNANPQMGFIASTKVVFINDKGFIDDKQLTLDLDKLDNPTLDDLLEQEYSTLCAFYLQGSLIRKEIIDAIGGFDEDMTGDDIVIRTKIFKYMQKKPELTFKIIKENNVFYRMHDSNVHKNAGRQIKIVTEYLERYWPDRPNPSILIDWMKLNIRTHSFEEYMPFFAINKRAASLLEEPSIQQIIKANVIKNAPVKLTNFQRYIFNKQRKNSEIKITLLGFLKFSYQRNNKTTVQPSSESNIHYTQYK